MLAYFLGVETYDFVVADGEIVATSTVPPPLPGAVTQLNALESARQLWKAAPADYTVSDLLARASREAGE